MVHRRWPGGLHRSAHQSAISQPGRPDRDRRRVSGGEPVKVIAARIGKSYQTVYREIARNSKPGGRYQPWYAHGQAHLRRRRPRPRVFEADPGLAAVVAGRLERRWSPGQISRWLRRRYPRRPERHVCTETIYDAVYRGLIVAPSPQLLRTARTYRHRRGRGRSREGALRQCTTIKPIRQRPAAAGNRRQAGHWEGDLERHEAPSNRAEVEGLRRCAVAAA